MNKKIASEIAIGIIVILAIVIGGLFWLQNKKKTQKQVANQPVLETSVTKPAAPVDETANWQTYKNEKYSFEFKYPQNWKTLERPFNPTSDLLAAVYATNNKMLDLADIDEPNREAGRGEIIYSVEIKQHGNTENYQLGTHYLKVFSNDKLDIFFIDDSRNSRKAEFDQIQSTLKFNEILADETANWQTYKNEKYGFELKYPQAYIIQDTQDGVVVIKSPSKPESYDIKIQINQNPSNLNLSLDAIIQNRLKSNPTKIDKKITLDGQTAYEGVDPGLTSEYEILVKSGDNFYDLLFSSGNKDTLEENKAALDVNQKLILSTFKFTNKADDVANWQTFKNDKYGFSIKYPENFNVYPNNDSQCENAYFEDKIFTDNHNINVDKIVKFEIFINCKRIQGDQATELGHYSGELAKVNFLAKESVKIGDNEYIRRKFQDDASGIDKNYKNFTFYTWEIKRAENSYIFAYNKSIMVNPEGKEQKFEQILSTLKFTK